jgi:Zn-dependent peptidase ImmA (M78 family)
MIAPLSYPFLKRLALEKRKKYGIITSRLGLREIREIYRVERIKIDTWDLPSKIRAIYMAEDGDPSVAINNKLPKEPKLFSLVHELKHHFVDQELITNGELRCGDYNANQVIEVGAEVFAAEFIYPEDEFVTCALGLGIQLGKCTQEDVVRLKRSCGAPVSYTFLRKRLERMGYAILGSLKDVQFRKLEEQMFGVPIYKQAWLRRKRVQP